MNWIGRVPTRLPMFWLALAYLAALFWLAIGYNTNSLIDPLKRIPDPIGSMPLAVPWFGALGGVLISLTGVVQHRYDWDERYWVWYLVRPFVGASVAIVAVMILQAGVLATGTDLSKAGADTRNITYYLAAWVVGYRESTFRALVKRLADVLFTSAEEGLPPRVLKVEPDTGPVAGGALVVIRGNGFSGAESVAFGAATASAIRVASDTEIEATTPAGTAGAVDISVTSPKGSASLAKGYTYV